MKNRDDIITEVVAWIGIIALLLSITLAIYSCSVSLQFQKGQDNVMSDTQTSDSKADLDLMEKRKKDKPSKDEDIKVIDTIKTDTIK